MVATAIYSVTMVLWKETAFPLCRATEKRWKMNVVSYYYYYFLNLGMSSRGGKQKLILEIIIIFLTLGKYIPEGV